MTQNIIVTETPSELRRLARAVLRGNWKKLFVGMLIYSIFAVLIPNLVSVTVKSLSYTVYLEGYDMNYDFPAFLYIYQLVMIGILQFGVYSFILHYLRTREVRYDRLFAGFERFAPVFLVSLLVSVLVGLWSLLFIIPGFVAMFRYFMALYILHDDPQVGVLGALRASKWMTNGNKAKIFLTILSFIGWRILASVPTAILDSMILRGGLAEVPDTALVIIEFALSLPAYFLMVYSETTMGLMYEIMSGRLRKTPPAGNGFMPQGGGSVL